MIRPKERRSEFQKANEIQRAFRCYCITCGNEIGSRREYSNRGVGLCESCVAKSKQSKDKWFRDQGLERRFGEERWDHVRNDGPYKILVEAP